MQVENEEKKSLMMRHFIVCIVESCVNQNGFERFLIKEFTAMVYR